MASHIGVSAASVSLVSLLSIVVFTAAAHLDIWQLRAITVQK